MKKWWEPKTVKFCLAVIAGAALAWATDQISGTEALVAIIGGLYGVLNRQGALKVENVLAPPPPPPEAPGDGGSASC